MAVYDRVYRGFTGTLTPAWSRPLVLARYSLQDVFKSRFFLAFFVACFIVPLGNLSVIYLRYNLEALAMLNLPLDQIITIDGAFFKNFFHRPQALFAFLLILVVGPSLVSPDLSNNAMPLYLSRPLTKFDYLIGRLAPLLILGSAVTVVPGLLLWLIQGFLAGGGWFGDNLGTAFAIIICSLAWVTSLSLLALAISSWVKWKMVARIVFLGLFFVGFTFGNIVNGLFDTWMGSFFDLLGSLAALQDGLFGGIRIVQMPTWAGWMTFVLLSVVSVFLLFRRIRAFEVV